MGREITGLGKNLSLSLPSPSPIGYSQEEVAMTCINYLNESVPVTGSVTVIGNINNPWFGLDPIGLTPPSTSWVINSVVVGSNQLMSLWNSFNGLLVGVGYFVPRWLAESVAIFGLLDAGFWLVGYPTIMSPAWALLSNVIYDLSLILYLRIAGVGRVLVGCLGGLGHQQPRELEPLEKTWHLGFIEAGGLVGSLSHSWPSTMN